MVGRTCLALLLCVVLLSASCGSATVRFECADTIGCVDVLPGEPVKIGVIQALSGDMGPQGQGLLRCIELVLADRDKTLLGHPLELAIADSMCSEEGGTTAALKIVADPQIVGILGPTCSGAAAAAMDAVSRAGLVMISSSSSAPALTSVGGEQGADWQPGFFRTAQNDSFSGQAAATFAFERLGARRAATIDDGGSYTRGLTDTFKKAFAELGGQVVLSAAVNKGDTNMEPVLTAVAMSGADLLYFAVYRPEGDYIVLQARGMEGLDAITLMTAEGLYFDSFLEAVGEAGVGLYFNAPATPRGPAYENFMTHYEESFEETSLSTPYHAHTYDATNLLLQAIERVAVRDEDGTLHIGRQALRDALYATAGYGGLTGTMTCDEYGDCAAIRIEVTRLDDPAAGFEGLAANVVYTYPPER
ncbi:MAG: branched-chain amino acid ABC transporter substrate-binding protein [Anaerolineae bacterium]|nr:branched-chain amino acid ABC transporter substrate-binding protein [Anaerolineae bacterium]